MKALIMNGVLVGVSLLISLIAVEAMLRIAHVSVPLAVSDRELGITYRKGITEETTNPESGEQVMVSVNQNGFRDDEWVNDERARVLVVGDSFVLAAEVAKEERFTELLEQRLSYVDTKREWNVLNAGVSGTGPDTYLARMKTFIPRLQPDYTIVVLYNGNDFHNVNYVVTPGGGRTNYEVVDGEVVARAVRASFTERVKWEARMFLSRFYIAQLINKRLTFVNAPTAPQTATLALPEYCTLPEERLEESFVITNKLLGDMNEVTNGRMLVVSIPDKAQLRDDLPTTCNSTQIEEYLAAEGEKLDVPFIALYERFKVDGGESLYFAGHLNAAGHRVTASAVYDALEGKVF